MKIQVLSTSEHRVFPQPSYVSDQDSKFQAILPGASSLASCSCGALSTDLLSDLDEAE